MMKEILRVGLNSNMGCNPGVLDRLKDGGVFCWHFNGLHDLNNILLDFLIDQNFASKEAQLYTQSTYECFILQM